MTLRVRDWTNIPAYWPVTLVDSEEDRELPFGPGTQYEFTVENDTKGGPAETKWGQNGTGDLPPVQTIEAPPSLTSGSKASAGRKAQATEQRFVLRIEADALPARVQSMEADVEDRHVILKWTTASETRGPTFMWSIGLCPPRRTAQRYERRKRRGASTPS